MEDTNFFNDGISIIITECPKGYRRKYVKAISSAVVLTKNIISDFKANVINNTLGGELDAYSNLAEKAFDICLERLKAKAEKLGYDGVCNIRAVTPSMAMGAAEIVLYGVAFVYVNNKGERLEKSDVASENPI